MYKKSVCFILVILFSAVLAAGLDAQEGNSPRIALLYSTDPSSSEQIQAFEQNVWSSLVFRMRVLGDYEILGVREYPEGSPEATLIETAREFDLDFAGIIHAELSEEGDYILAVSVYDVSNGTELFRNDARARNEGDIAENTERLIRETITASYPYEIGWSSIEVEADGPKDGLIYYIDGIKYGRGDTGLTGIPSGSRILTVRQQRPFGPATVFQEKLELSQDASVEVSVSLPELTEEEQEGLAAIDRAILSAWKNQDYDVLSRQLTFAEALLEGTGMSTALNEAREKYASWQISYDRGDIPEEIAASFDEPEDIPFQPETAPTLTGNRKSRITKGTLIGTGVLLSLAGSAGGVFNVESRHRADTAYREYLQASENFDSLFSSYTDSYNYYRIGTLTTYGVYGGGFMLLSTGIFGFRDSPILLSRLGKYSAALAAVTGVSGSVLQHIGNIQKVHNRDLYEDYLSASENLDSLYSEYRSGFVRYSAGRITGYALWGTSALLTALSPFLPGEKTAPADSFFGKTLLSAGVLMIACGNIASGFAHEYLLESQKRFDDYAGATENLDELYDDYLSSHKGYTVSSITAYGLWAAGTVSVLTSLFTPFGRGKPTPSDNRPVTLSAVPAPGGVTLKLHGSYR